MKQQFDLQKRERGQGLVEYALILVLVAVVSIVVMGTMGGTVSNVFCNVVKTLNTTTGCGTVVVVTTTTVHTPPQNGDTCVDYDSGWYYIWRYNGTTWSRIAEPHGSLSTCSFTHEADNHSRDPYV